MEQDTTTTTTGLNQSQREIIAETIDSAIAQHAKSLEPLIEQIHQFLAQGQKDQQQQPPPATNNNPFQQARANIEYNGEAAQAQAQRSALTPPLSDSIIGKIQANEFVDLKDIFQSIRTSQGFSTVQPNLIAIFRTSGTDNSDQPLSMTNAPTQNKFTNFTQASQCLSVWVHHTIAANIENTDYIQELTAYLSYMLMQQSELQLHQWLALDDRMRRVHAQSLTHETLPKMHLHQVASSFRHTVTNTPTPNDNYSHDTNNSRKRTGDRDDHNPKTNKQSNTRFCKDYNKPGDGCRDKSCKLEHSCNKNSCNKKGCKGPGYSCKS